MKKIYLKIFLFFLLTAHINIIYCQNSVPQDYISKIMPASPEGFKLGSFGNTPIGLFTGAPNINIPISTFTNGNISVPISLNYSSNGIRVDEMNGSVGLGWSLISAGVITRIVRDLPDENTVSLEMVPDIDLLGLWSPDVVNYISSIEDDGADSEPDVYMANFAGNNIRFSFDKNGRPFLISKSDFQVIGESGGNTFTLVSDSGVKYEFSTIEKSIFRNTGAVHSTPYTYTSSWFLSKITSPDENEVYIEYENTTYNTTISQSATMKYTPPGAVQYKYVEEGGLCMPQIFVIPANINNNKITSIQILSGKQIKTIYSKDSTGNIVKQMVFTYNPLNNSDLKPLKSINYSYLNSEILNYNFEYSTTANGRLFLKNIINTKDSNKYEFGYINQNTLPQRLSTLGDVSLSRDMWGLYNGKINNTLIPQIYKANDPYGIVYAGADQSFDSNIGKSGLLNKITYPTKGYTEIVYEPHIRKESIVIPGSGSTYAYVGLNVASTELIKNMSDAITFTPTQDEFVKVSVPKAYMVGECDYQPNHIKGDLSIKENNVFQSIFIYSSQVNGFIPYPYSTISITPNMADTEFYIHLHKNVPITFKLSTYSWCVNASFKLSYRISDGTPDTTQQIDVPFGGFRIQSTTDTPLIGNALTRNYTYSSVNVLRKPYFLELQTDRIYCGISGGYSDLNYYTLTSNNLNQLNAINPNIFYEHVTEEINGKGKVIHTFDITSDYFGKTLIGKDISTSPWTNFGWKNGKEIITTYKDNLDNKLKEVKFNYVNDESKVNSIDGISVRKNFTLKHTNNVTLKCTEDNINSSYEQYYCLANHSHVWWSIDGYKHCHGAGHIDKWVTFYSYCYGRNVGDVIVKPNIFENLDVVQYKNISRFEYLRSQSTTDFLNGNELKTITEYFYNNPSHYQLTDQKVTFPDLSTQESNYKYAHDKGNTYLIDKNIIGVPLETVVNKTANGVTKTTSKTETKYPISQIDADTKTAGLPLPISVASLDLQTNGMTTEVLYKQYDSKGNLLQYNLKPDVSGEAGNPVTIIWGYNQTQPIAKIEGAKLSDITQTLINSIVNASDDTNANYSESTLLNQLDAFRIALPNFQISTYTYKPLIGVTTITPPSGIREYYFYDTTTNRLESVKTNENGVLTTLKEYQYHYKP